MTQRLLLFLCLCLISLSLSAQTKEELKAQKAEKEAELAAIKGEVAALKKQIETFPGWKFGSLGTLGFNVSQFSDWLGAENPNARQTSIGLSGNAFANYDDDKQFWRNAGNLTYVRTKLVADPDADDALPDSLKAGFETTADAINVSSLYGYKLAEDWALSGLGEYRSTLQNFNDPGYLDLGIGATWTPITNLVVVFHPLNYNFVFSSGNLDYESSLGCKIVADYTQSLPMGIAWRSNLSAFASYKDFSNLSNWTWINSFGMSLWKGLGVGFELGLRNNKQERYNQQLIDMPDLKLEDVSDNPLQVYWLLGLTYAL